MKLSIDISDDQIKGLLCDAFEGGCYYWLEVAGYVFPPGTIAEDFNKGGKHNPEKGYWHPSEIIPLFEGGKLKVVVSKPDDKTTNEWEPTEQEKKEWKDGDEKVYLFLTREKIEKGLYIMLEKCPEEFADIISENDDANTGDLFVQCCLFGDVIFG